MKKNTYKTFFCKLAVFAILFIGVDYISGYAFRFLEHKALNHSPFSMITEYTMWKVNTDLVVIGASEANHSYVINQLEDSLGVTAYNCGKDGCRFYYQNAMINGLLDRYTPKTIIWSISPSEFSTPSPEDVDRVKELNPFYHTNGYCKTIVQTKSPTEWIKMESQLYTYNSRLIIFLFKSFTPGYAYKKGGYAPLYGTNSNLVLTNRKWKENYNTTSEKYFVSTLERCKKQGTEVVLVFTPRYEKGDYSDLKEYKRLKYVCSKLDVPVIEDLYHNQTLMKPELFKDNAHLNDEGAHIYTNMIIDRIKTNQTK